MSFEEYVAALARHEATKSIQVLEDPRDLILVHSGVRLNNIGDYLTDTSIEWHLEDVPVDHIGFCSTTPARNRVLLDQCERSPVRFKQLLASDDQVRATFARDASFGDEPLLLKKVDGGLRVVDGMHRLVGAILCERLTVSAFVPRDALPILPKCEAHTVYDLIRGYQKNARDEQGQRDLFHGLRLLCRTYANAVDLLRHRFSSRYIPDEDVQQTISSVLNVMATTDPAS